MYMTLSVDDFMDAFNDAGRGNQFSSQGLRAMFDYFTDLEDQTGEPMELDVVAICCDYTEYDSALDAASEYGFEPEEDDSPEDAEDSAFDWLQERTVVIPIGEETSEGVIIAAF